jgi:hypothetical protein
LTSIVRRSHSRAGDLVIISCRSSKYFGIVAPVFEIEADSGYVMLDLPRGTEKRLEGIAHNTLFVQRKKWKGIKPKGDPQWFPPEWLSMAKPASRQP